MHYARGRLKSTILFLPHNLLIINNKDIYPLGNFCKKTKNCGIYLAIRALFRIFVLSNMFSKETIKQNP
jgi:hypothetical protein